MGRSRVLSLVLIVALVVAACGEGSTEGDPTTTTEVVTTTPPTTEPPPPTTTTTLPPTTTTVPPTTTTTSPPASVEEVWDSLLAEFEESDLELQNIRPHLTTAAHCVQVVLGDPQPEESSFLILAADIRDGGESDSQQYGLTDVFPDDLMAQLEAGFDECGEIDNTTETFVQTGESTGSMETIAGVEGALMRVSSFWEFTDADLNDRYEEQRQLVAIIGGYMVRVIATARSEADYEPARADALLEEMVERIRAHIHP